MCSLNFNLNKDSYPLNFLPQLLQQKLLSGERSESSHSTPHRRTIQVRFVQRRLHSGISLNAPQADGAWARRQVAHKTGGEVCGASVSG